MGQGLRVWDQYGNLTVDSDFRMSRVIGKIYVNWLGNGSVNVPEFGQGTPWVMIAVDWANMFYDNHNSNIVSHNYAMPKISGQSVVWSWGPELNNEAYCYATWIIYGVY